MSEQMKLVCGNTYPVKEQIKQLGGRWDAANKGWRVPSNNYDKAVALVFEAPKSSGPSRTGHQGSYRTIGGRMNSRRTGCSCGSIEGRPRASDCASCQHDY